MGLYGKLLTCDRVARVVFLNTNPSNFRRPLRSLLLRYTAENYRSPKFNMVFKFLLTKFFKSDLFSCLQKVDHVVN